MKAFARSYHRVGEEFLLCRNMFEGANFWYATEAISISRNDTRVIAVT